MNKNILILVTIILCFLGGVTYTFYYFSSNVEIETAETIKITEDISSKKSDRNFNGKISKFEEDSELGMYLDSENTELQAKRVDNLRNYAWSSEVGEYKGIKKSVDELKKVIEDEKISNEVRSKAVRTLGSFFCKTGRDQNVFDIVYSGDYKKYGNNGNTTLASREMSQWSYDLYPDYRNATAISHTLIEAAITAIGNGAEVSELKGNIDLSKEYMDKAEVMAQKNGKDSSGKYNAYLFWRAVNFGQMAVFDEKYIDRAEKAFKDSLGYIKKKSNNNPDSTIGQQYPYTLYRYAEFLYRIYGDNKNDEIKEIGEQIVDFVNRDENKDINFFLKTIKLSAIDKKDKFEALKKSRGYNIVIVISQRSKVFKDFLSKYGLNIGEDEKISLYTIEDYKKGNE